MANTINIEVYTDSRGSLGVIQNSTSFVIKRVYYIFGASGLRGGHKHHKTRQIAICINGSCSIRVYNKSENKDDEYCLNRPNTALFIEPDDFHWMHSFSSDCVLLVLADEEYNKNDYIYEK
jgi:dTDP-4-dehydrorhamnose 3,5-epimerase-like enzyme